MDFNQNEVCLFESLNTLSFNALTQSDIIVPDTKSDINNVIRVSGCASLDGKTYKNGKINLFGKVNFKIIYIGDDDLKSVNLIEHSAPFNHEADFSNNFDEENVAFNLSDTTFTYEIINTRKICVSCEVKINANILNTTNRNILLNDETFKDNSVFVKSQSVKRDAVKSVMEFNIPVSENFSITDSGTEYEILDISIKDNIQEIKTVNTKLVLKLLSDIYVLYRVDSNISSFCAESSHTEIVDANDILGDDKIILSTYPSSYDYEIDITQSGVSLKLDYNISASLCSFTPIEEEYVNDIYSVQDAYEVENSEIPSICIETYPKNTTTIKDDINLPYDTIKEILFMDTDLCIKDIKKENSNAKLISQAKINLIYKNENDVIKSINHKTPFEIETQFPLNDDEEIFMPGLKCVDFSYVISSPSQVVIRILVDTFLNKLTKSKTNVVTSFNIIKTQSDKTTQTPSMVIYYPDTDMALWDVSKKFNTSKEEILKINSLSNLEILPKDKPVIIPKMKKSIREE